MAFDKEAEANETEHLIKLVFDSGRPMSEYDLPMPPSAYLALGSFSSNKGDPMLTTREYSFGALEAQVRELQAVLEARLAEAKARFLATISN
jgi:hypothetical protein